MRNRITPVVFIGIRRNLERSADTWVTLWLLLNLTQVNITQLLRCRYLDWQGDVLVLPAYGLFAEKRIALSPGARAVIDQRRNRYPIQSHSLRESHSQTRDSHCAQHGAQGGTGKSSSKSASYIPSASVTTVTITSCAEVMAL